MVKYLHFEYAIHCCRTVVNDNVANVRLSWICEGKERLISNGNRAEHVLPGTLILISYHS